MMTSREKVRNALNHQQSEIPLDLGALNVSGIHCLPMAALREHYGLEKIPVRVMEPYQMLGVVEDDLRAALGIDTAPVWDDGCAFGVRISRMRPWVTPWGQEVRIPEKMITGNVEGKIYTYAAGDTSYPPSAVMPRSGYFFDAIERQKPFDDEELNYLDNTEEFGIIPQENIDYMAGMAKAGYEAGYSLVGTFGSASLGDIGVVPGMALRDPKGIRSIEEWYVSLVTRQTYIHRIFERQVELAIENYKNVHAGIGDKIDVLYVSGTDFGTQRGPFCSNETFNTLFKPYLKRLNDWIHGNTGWKTIIHTCGSIIPLMKEIIDCGFDIMNPVQFSAHGMDLDVLKKEYGDDLVFWGGAVNTQYTLPYGTKEQIREEVFRCADILGKNGGFVFTAVHNIQANVPVENIVAYFEAVKEVKR
jgi:hypothetical protein